MLVIRCTLLRDTFEGGDPSSPDFPEWPPSWMRLFSAMVAAADLRSEEERSLLQRLENLPPPSIAAIPVTVERGAETVRRAWVPVNGVESDPQDSTSTTLPARKNLERTWSRFAPRSPLVMYLWPELELSDEERRMLDSVLRRVPYLGRSTCPVVLDLAEDDVVSATDGLLIPRSAVGQTDNFTVVNALRVPTGGSLDALERTHERRLRGEPAYPWEVGTFMGYGGLGGASRERPTAGPFRDLVILALDGPTRDGRHVVRLTDLLRKAVLANLSKHLPVVSGHWPDPPQGATQCAFLALPFVGHQHADGHIVGVGIALPELDRQDFVILSRAIDATVRNGLRDRPLGEFKLRRVNPIDAAREVLTLRPWRWMKPARRWVTVFPAVLDRYPKNSLPIYDAICVTVENAGYPRPSNLHWSRRHFRQLAPGAIDLSARDVRRPDHEEPIRPYLHLCIEFPRPVHGPVVVGAMRYYGLGLCLPLGD